MKLKCLFGIHDRNGVSNAYVFTDKVTSHCLHCNKELYMDRGKVKAMNQKVRNEIQDAQQQWRDLDDVSKEAIKEEANKETIVL